MEKRDKEARTISSNDEVVERGKRMASEIKMHMFSIEAAEPCPPTFYNAEDIWRLLGSSVEVFAYKSCEKWRANETIDGTPGTGHTHSAYLIGIKPIVKESREAKMEGLLKELIASEGLIYRTQLNPLFERAKKLLEEK